MYGATLEDVALKMDVGVTLEDRLEYDSPLKEKGGQDCWFGVGTRQ